MRAILIGALAAAVLAAGCSTTSEEQSPAAVEERKPGDSAGSAQKPPPPVDSKPIARVDVTGKPGATPYPELKDPRNILSQRSIFYDYDRFDVKDEYRKMVEAHAKFLREHPQMKILIQGNTDERGSREYNVGLGQRRADGVRRMMVLLGVKEDQVESVSLGEEKPRADGSDEKAYAQNRRSDILYSGEF